MRNQSKKQKQCCNKFNKDFKNASHKKKNLKRKDHPGLGGGAGDKCGHVRPTGEVAAPAHAVPTWRASALL